MDDNRVKDPKGLEALADRGITKESVVRSSLAYHMEMGTKEIDHMTPEILSGFLSKFGQDKVGGELDGIFNLPIAVCHGGECISNHERKDRNYPCILGEKFESWRPKNPPTEKDYMAVSVLGAVHNKFSSLIMRYQQYDFLDATGL